MRWNRSFVFFLLSVLLVGNTCARGAQEEEPNTATIKIQRTGHTGWLGLSVAAYLNGEKLGAVDTEEIEEFTFVPADTGVNSLYFQSTWWQGDTHTGDSTSLVATPGSVTFVSVNVTRRGVFNSVPVFHTNIVVKKVGRLAASGEDPTQVINNEAYQRLVSDACADPQWFKANLNSDLARKKPSAVALELSKPTLRLLALSVLFLPVLLIAMYRSDPQTWKQQPGTMTFGMFIVLGLLVGGVFLGAMVVQMVMNLARFAAIGSEAWFSYPFALFCTMALLLLGVAALTLEPVLKAVREGAPVARFLGIAGIMIEVLGLLFTLRDAAQIFW